MEQQLQASPVPFDGQLLTVRPYTRQAFGGTHKEGRQAGSPLRKRHTPLF
jgi:hypothetical protein